MAHTVMLYVIRMDEMERNHLLASLSSLANNVKHSDFLVAYLLG